MDNNVRQVVERAVKTFAQTFAATLVAAGATGLLDAPWSTALSVAGLAAVLSVCTSLVSYPFGPEGPSLVAGDPTVPGEPLFGAGDWPIPKVRATVEPKPDGVVSDDE